MISAVVAPGVNTAATPRRLHAGVAQGAGDDLGAVVMTVEAGLRDDDADPSRRGHQNTGFSV
jgi:hypothetical protein